MADLKYADCATLNLVDGPILPDPQSPLAAATSDEASYVEAGSRLERILHKPLERIGEPSLDIERKIASVPFGRRTELERVTHVRPRRRRSMTGPGMFGPGSRRRRSISRQKLAGGVSAMRSLRTSSRVAPGVL